MAELIIKSYPTGAQVTIGGTVVGTAPLMAQITKDVISEFRETCMSGETVTCSWSILHDHLIDQTISSLWWDLTEGERRSIAEKAIRNTLFYEIYEGRPGKPGCAGGEGPCTEIVCLQNAAIRCLKFADKTHGGDTCYYIDPTDGEEYCYKPEVCYGLPCNVVSCGTYGAGFGHSMASIQVVNNFDSLSNWVIFQYNTYDIRVGDPQIPTYRYDLRLSFCEIGYLPETCNGLGSRRIAIFEHI